jgi:DNA-binding winged helix-turn-helix (wHTH) protein
MTVAIALPTHRARMLVEPRNGVGLFVGSQQGDLPAPANDGMTGASRVTAIRFGAFCVHPKQRLLLEADQPVRLGSRALDILITLIEHHGELVTRRELMARVWPGMTVVDANLSVHIAALRRALRDGQDGNRYLVTTPAQGYRFVAPISITEDPPSGPSWLLSATEQDFDLRAMLARLIGSADEVRRLASELLLVSESGVAGSTNAPSVPAS